jgi:hypothetical protein
MKKGLFNVPGLTLRDYFAAMALNGAIILRNDPETEGGRSDIRRAYQYADAMLKEREKTKWTTKTKSQR